jgi:hypothetical protein
MTESHVQLIERKLQDSLNGRAALVALMVSLVFVTLLALAAWHTGRATRGASGRGPADGGISAAAVWQARPAKPGSARQPTAKPGCSRAAPGDGVAGNQDTAQQIPAMHGEAR